ncbi:hypothetical protein PP707_00475 [Acetobacter pasteurianus]|nr:hypothetical protein [Acetobacter pasteurianus]
MISSCLVSLPLGREEEYQAKAKAKLNQTKSHTSHTRHISTSFIFGSLR